MSRATLGADLVTFPENRYGMEITHFTPGQLMMPGPPLAAYRSTTPAGALSPYLEAYTQPGDLVIDLFCQGPTLVFEAAQAGRNALGLNINRALLLAASLGLTPVEHQAVEAACTQLAEARKGVETLQAHIEGLYRTKCASCGKTVIADAFIWERDGDAPVEKRYHCATCAEAPAQTDAADRTAASSFQSRGLSYWLLLDRAASATAPHRDRMAALLDLYTPRNLSAVNDLLLKSDGLTLTPAVRSVVDALLLDTFDGAASLRPPDAAASRPRRLQRPGRYVEANVWRLFERAIETWRKTISTPVPHAPDLTALLAPAASEARAALAPGSCYLAPLSSGQAGRDLPPGCAALIIVDPPRPDTVLWHLSALWCQWLWGAQAGAPLTTFLGRRWLDKDWLWRGLRSSLKAVASLLRPDGRLVCPFYDENPVILEALTLAATGAGYRLVGWGVRPPGENRFAWRLDTARTARSEAEDGGAQAEVDTLSRDVAEHAVDISLEALRTLGEPVAWPTLHAAIFTGLSESSLLARIANLPDDAAETHAPPATQRPPLSWLTDTIRSALDGAPLVQSSARDMEATKDEATGPLWWLDPALESAAAPPLSDRVELAVAETLRGLAAASEAELLCQVCARFPGYQTPDLYLIRLCLSSYGVEHAAGHWRLRHEDDLEARAAEINAIVADLGSLGRRLEFEVVLGKPEAGEWAVRWLDEAGHAPYVFAVRTSAVLGDLLFGATSLAPSLQADGKEGETIDDRPTPCLALPGGRAVLVGYKLSHDPRMRQQVQRHGWRFLKFRHLRHLVQEVEARKLDRYAFQAALGLDPIVEQEEAQLSLW